MEVFLRGLLLELGTFKGIVTPVYYNSGPWTNKKTACGIGKLGLKIELYLIKIKLTIWYDS